MKRSVQRVLHERLEIGFQLAGLASSAIYIMHNRAHHRISISSSYKGRGGGIVVSRKMRGGSSFLPSCPSYRPGRRLLDERWRHVRQSENVWPCKRVSWLPRSETSLKSDSHNSIRGGPGDERSRDVKLFSISFYENFLSLIIVRYRWTYSTNRYLLPFLLSI